MKWETLTRGIWNSHENDYKRNRQNCQVSAVVIKIFDFYLGCGIITKKSKVSIWGNPSDSSPPSGRLWAIRCGEQFSCRPCSQRRQR